MSRRGAVKVNPVTGKMEKVTAADVPAGKHRDGCLLVDDRYVNAAKDLGLGSDKGAAARTPGARRARARVASAARARAPHLTLPALPLLPARAAGMYGHLKALTGMGKGAADIPTGTSMGGSEAASAPTRASAAPLHGWGAGRKAGEAALASGGGSSSAIADAVADRVKTAPKAVGAGNVHGFASKTAGGSKLHTHADSFQRAKGVVNTVGGAKDINRAERGEPAKLPGKGEAKGAHIMGFSTLDAHTVEGKARREAANKREAAGGNAVGMKLVHVSGGGGRPPAHKMSNANIGRLGGDVTFESSGPSARAGGAPPTLGSAPVREAPKAARIVGVEKLESSSGVLGGSSAANVAGGADAARAARAAHFDKMFAEKAALKAAAVERLGMGTTDGYVGAKKAAAAPHPIFS